MGINTMTIGCIDAKTSVAVSPFIFLHPNIVIWVRVVGSPSCTHHEKQQQRNPECRIQQHPKHRQLNHPHQYSRYCNRSAFGCQHCRHPPFPTHITAPASTQPAAKAFCGSDAGCRVHSVHLLQHIIPVRSNPVCWPVPKCSSRSADCRARASFQTRYTGLTCCPLNAASVHH